MSGCGTSLPVLPRHSWLNLRKSSTLSRLDVTRWRRRPPMRRAVVEVGLSPWPGAYRLGQGRVGGRDGAHRRGAPRPLHIFATGPVNRKSQQTKSDDTRTKEAWIKANPDKAAYPLESVCRRMAQSFTTAG
jgi:hypothetical protein